jgi:predicted nucleic acid-binding protein
VILVDTSVWVDHLRAGDAGLVDLLERRAVVCHPWVTGEIALGRLSRRDEILRLLGSLPQAEVATPTELRAFVEAHRLFGLGIGYVDAQLLASARLTPDTLLWTRDRPLAAVAARLGLLRERRGDNGGAGEPGEGDAAYLHLADRRRQDR